MISFTNQNKDTHRPNVDETSKSQLWERCSQVCYIITLGMCTLFSISSVHFWSCLCIFSTILYQRSTFKMPTGYDKKRGRERTVKKKWNVDSNALSPRKYVTVLTYWILKLLLVITTLILIWIKNTRRILLNTNT